MSGGIRHQAALRNLFEREPRLAVEGCKAGFGKRGGSVRDSFVDRIWAKHKIKLRPDAFVWDDETDTLFCVEVSWANPMDNAKLMSYAKLACVLDMLEWGLVLTEVSVTGKHLNTWDTFAILAYA
ncbi:MAG: hypothetical protein H0U59_13855 [Gemmatimonadaceae bacterium]|nr:hypothetical protein [Gemmatimonadaceae bacterium]MBA3762672.1 hypothetical protein [Chthoniobacterales bacterium]